MEFKFAGFGIPARVWLGAGAARVSIGFGFRLDYHLFVPIAGGLSIQPS
jgi:hypothetical protein